MARSLPWVQNLRCRTPGTRAAETQATRRNWVAFPRRIFRHFQVIDDLYDQPGIGVGEFETATVEVPRI